MTQESKQLLLEFLTGNITEGVPSAMPLTETQISGSNIFNALSNYADFTPLGILYSNDFSNSIVYGNYDKYNCGSMTNGLLIIVDSNLNVIQTLTQYSSGTEFNVFKKLEFDEENYIYGIDRGGTYSNGTWTEAEYNRFIMLTNPLANVSGDYSVKLRYSLYIQEDNLEYYYKNDIQKVIGSPVYILTGGKGTLSNYKIQVSILKVQVGETPDWQHYTGTIDNSYVIASSIYYEYSNDTFNVLNIYYGNSGSIYRGDLVKNGDIYNFTETKLYDAVVKDISIKNKTQIYMLTETELNKINNANTTPEILIIHTLEDTLDSGSLFRINEITAIGYKCLNNRCYVGVIDLNDFPTITGLGQSMTTKYLLGVYNSYLLYKIFFVTDDNNTFIERCIYSSTLYNGESYNDILSLYPTTARLYWNGRCEFARRLYNKVVINNKTNSIVEIPFTLLNGMNIENSNLLSFTNNIITNYSNSFVKNIYETLYLNFTNTINMINTITGIYSDEGATRLNQSTSNTWTPDYDNCQLKKYRVNFNDNTSRTLTIPTINYSNGIANAIFNIFVPNGKLIESIDLISNDGMSVFNTITELSDGSLISDLTQGFYQINQQIEVE